MFDTLFNAAHAPGQATTTYSSSWAVNASGELTMAGCAIACGNESCNCSSGPNCTADKCCGKHETCNCRCVDGKPKCSCIPLP